jgi:hypothetical protein
MNHGVPPWRCSNFVQDSPGSRTYCRHVDWVQRDRGGRVFSAARTAADRYGLPISGKRRLPGIAFGRTA